MTAKTATAISFVRFLPPILSTMVGLKTDRFLPSLPPLTTFALARRLRLGLPERSELLSVLLSAASLPAVRLALAAPPARLFLLLAINQTLLACSRVNCDESPNACLSVRASIPVHRMLILQNTRQQEAMCANAPHSRIASQHGWTRGYPVQARLSRASWAETSLTATTKTSRALRRSSREG